MLTPEAGTPGRASAVRRSVAGTGAPDAYDVESASSGAVSPRDTPEGDDLGAVCGALLMTVYLPRAILSTGSGLTLVARPLWSKHLGCNDTQTGLIAAAVPLVRPRAPAPPIRGYARGELTRRPFPPIALFAPASRAQGRMLANMPAGLTLSHGVGSSSGMALGALVLAVSALVTAAATGYRTLLLGAALSGVGESMFNIATQALVRNAVGSHMHGRTLSVLAAIPRWATIASPVAGSALVTWIGWPAPFVAFAALALAAAACVLVAPGGGAGGCAGGRAGEVQPPPPPLRRTGSRAALAAGTARLRSTAALHWRAIATGGVAVACLNALRAVRQLYLPLHGADAGMSELQVGWAVTIGFALDSALIVPSGVVMDRRGRKLTGVPAFLLLAAGVALIPAATTPRGLVLVGALLGCGNGLSAGISGTLAADLGPPAPDTGAFLGLWRFVADAGSLVGPVAAGALSRATSLRVAARCVGLFGAAGAAWLAFVVPETARVARPRQRAAADGRSGKAPRGARRSAWEGWARAVRAARRSLAARLRAAGIGRRPDGLRLLSV